MGSAVTANDLLNLATAERAACAPWLETLREKGRSTFAAQGLPHRRVESWRYSDLLQALGHAVASDAAAHDAPALAGALVAVFENGIFDAAASSLHGLDAVCLTEALAEAQPSSAEEIGTINPQTDHPIVGLNAALMENGIVIRVPAGMTLEAPIHLQFHWQGAGADVPGGSHLRVLVVLEEGAEATLVETHSGTPGFATVVSELKLADRAQLTHVRLETFGPAARQTAVTLGEIGEQADYHAYYQSEGGHLDRHEALLKLVGEAANVEIDGVYLIADTRHVDNTVVLTHAAEATTSRQTFRGVLSGRSHGAYQGCVQVRPEGQRTDAKQMSRALLLSRRAEVANKPELEILADDVKCSHGATAGELDANALFFMRARGIPEEEARRLLVSAFLDEALTAVANEALRALAADAVHGWLAQHAGDVSHVD